MPADRRLFDSSSFVTPPTPEIDAVTNNVEVQAKFDSAWLDRHLTLTPYEPAPPWHESPFHYLTMPHYRVI